MPRQAKPTGLGGAHGQRVPALAKQAGQRRDRISGRHRIVFWGCGQRDFGYEQWRAMLTPVLRAVFAPGRPPPRRPADPRAALMRRLRAAERLRGEFAGLAPEDGSTA
jgi:hypothetical protein